jgi:2-methylisocitrate lyase-like PEP mutase family enzyme
MANMSNANPKGMPTPDEFDRAGAAMMTFPSVALFAATGAVTRAMAALKRDKTYDAVRPDLCSLDDYYRLVGLAEQNQAEADYFAAATTIVSARGATKR